jgi:molybdopterin-containing oxidoreductase family iron-sulfur binding subunit
MMGRHIVVAGTIDEYRKNPHFVKEEAEEPPKELTIYPGYKYEGYAWGMAIDQTACVGCNACVVACQAENNIAVVGKDQVQKMREMHWLRIDTYYKGSPDNPETYFQPLPCMQCENAPCELVCPVQATNHSSEGLNDMVYNRCVGTRYCSNNCPYKVRRFNFFLYSDWNTSSLKLQRNPDVSVRSRGVMEKCTYCVQRISEAKIEAEKEDRRVKDGEIQTACQGVCPTQAIVFGDINDPNSRVAKLKAEQLNYSLLAELNTRPRTTYLAALRNPNPEIEKA